MKALLYMHGVGVTLAVGLFIYGTSVFLGHVLMAVVY